MGSCEVSGLNWKFDTRDAIAANAARASLMETLRTYGGDEGESDFVAAELILAELIGNLVRHAPGQVRVKLQWDGRYPVLHTFDRGCGFSDAVALPIALPEDPFESCGRGLYIIATLGSDFRIDPRAGDGTHVHVRLPVAKSFASAGFPAS